MGIWNGSCVCLVHPVWAPASERSFTFDMQVVYIQIIGPRVRSQDQYTIAATSVE